MGTVIDLLLRVTIGLMFALYLTVQLFFGKGILARKRRRLKV